MKNGAAHLASKLSSVGLLLKVWVQGAEFRLGTYPRP